MTNIKENLFMLKRLCLEVDRAKTENGDLLLKYYSENQGKIYSDFLRTEKGRISDNNLKISIENLDKVIKVGCTEYSDGHCLDVTGILEVLKILEEL